MKKYICMLILVGSVSFTLAQHTLTLQVNDSTQINPLVGVNVLIPALKRGTTTNTFGWVTFTNIPSGRHRFTFSYIGYETLSQTLTFPLSQDTLYINLTAKATDMQEVVITSNRANRSVANTPSRIEVLTDEVEEAATMDPAKIAHLLMHTTGVQVQQTSATTGSARVRIQGQYGRYTQILKDGFPLYGGFTGGLGVLQIPPLDLRQVEFVKGASSTLYGGGAIAGLINLISKEPKQEDEFSVHLNLSHIGNRDLNSFYSRRIGKWGFTLFGSYNTNTLYDVDEDGFTDVPEVEKLNLNPKVFFYPDEKTTISLGGTFTDETRLGGEVSFVEEPSVNTGNSYFEENTSQQLTTQFLLDRKVDDRSRLTLKNSTNRFERNIRLNNYEFAGTQFSTFSEFSYSINPDNQSLILGANVYTDRFDEEAIETTELRNQNFFTMGLFAQHIWDIDPQLALESGFRLDYNTDYGVFPLPKVALVYKPSFSFTARLGLGLGYKLPSIFNEDAEALAFENVAAVNADTHEAERSMGLNGELTYRIIASEQISITITEYLFYNRLNDPLILQQLGNGRFNFTTSPGYFETKGMETLVKASAGHFHLYLGYTFVDANINDGNETRVLPLTPRHSIHADLMFVQDHRWRMGVDAEYESRQTLASGREVRSLFKAGFLCERMLGILSVYVNFENFTDTRQTQYESLVIAPATNPRFTEVWAPLDGFILNGGIKIKM